MARIETDIATQPWAVAEADYPQGAGARERVRFLLRYAILAPSGHNTQPWLFRTSGDVVELRADRTRALPVVDPDDREMIVSCGAALATLLIAAEHFGHFPEVELLPDPGDEDLLARVSLALARGRGRGRGRGLALARGGTTSAGADELFDAITARRTNRQAFERRDVPDELVARLVADAADERVVLHLVPDEARGAVARLIAEGDRIQMSDGRFRRELAAWLHPNRSPSSDGMRGYGFGFGDLASQAGPRIIRSFDLGRGQAAKDRALAEGSPLLAVLVTTADDPAAWLATGQALQRVLLRAHTAGVWSSFLNQPVEVPRLRPRLAEAIGRPDEWPQLVIRLGYGPSVQPEPRRLVDDVLVAGED